jgi:FkbH-like protein
MNGPPLVKCVVWDLDHTLWDGILLEDAAVTLRPGVVDVIRAIDERGILQSVASRNDRDRAMQTLERFGLHDFFLYPQIHWNAKVSSLESIAASLNLALDAFAFVDDDPFERDAVRHAHPEILCLDATDIPGLLARAAFTPAVVTDDAQARRLRYQSEIERTRAAEAFDGPPEAFLAGLGMVLTVFPAESHDLARAGELMVRTHQLNTTGRTYSHDELETLLSSPRQLLLMANLEDCYGQYGTIGLALIETAETTWTIKLLLMSCRVAARGAGSVLIQHLRALAKKRGVRLLADFVETPRNRQMFVTYRLAGFRERERLGPAVVLESDQDTIAGLPDYVVVVDRCLATPSPS